MDITKTVTEVKTVFTVFEMPLKSMQLLRDFTHPNARHIYTIGNKNFNKNSSIIRINSIIEPFVITALEILPLKVIVAIIMGIKAVETLHSVSMNVYVVAASEAQILKTANEVVSVEHIEKVLSSVPFVEFERELNSASTSKRASREEKQLSTLTRPDNK